LRDDMKWLGWCGENESLRKICHVHKMKGNLGRA
jgi:hypothetical protein